eukprot:TRINITY_DN6342_c0_g2_i2.p1 TRINITY_DN6342_c0_g2~~TRINITY_DN6342_c0_g2_i2.p1  ORF type:complete len:466 (-),score=88.90 TRINITY_DN6342_c0_g2_i2:519-1916(-)
MPREKGAGWGPMSSLHVALCCFLVLALGFSLAFFQLQRNNIELYGVPTNLVSGARTFLRQNPNVLVPTAEPQSAEEFAETAFEYWRAKVHPQIAALDVRNASWHGPDDDTWQRLQDLNLSSLGDHCLYLFSYKPSADDRPKVSWDEDSKVCRMAGADPFYKRAKVLAAALEMVMEPHRDEFDHPFQFYIDVTDGTRNIPEIGRLGLPVVAWAYSQKNDRVLPFADYYSIVGHFFPKIKAQMPEDLHGWGETMHGVYGRDKIPLVDWATKRPEAVYRGTCSLTFDPDTPTGNLAIRPELCRKAALAPYFDLGMGGNFGDPKNEWPTQQLANVEKACMQCAVRQGGALTRAQMMTYKYQVVVDGWATTCDSTHWKLLSNSAVIIVRPDRSDQPPWAYWYQTFLVPGRDFVPSTISEVGETIEWCLENDGEAREIARNAREFVLTKLTKEGVAHFMLLTLRYLSGLYE